MTDVRETIDLEIDRVCEYIANSQTDTKEYAAALRRLDELIDLDRKVQDAPGKSIFEKIINNPSLVGALAQLLGILWLTQHERLNVVTSRALSWIRFK